MVVLARGPVEVATWPLGACRPPDLEIIDRLARLHLDVARAGYVIRLRDAGADLWDLLRLAGLDGAVADADAPDVPAPAGPPQPPENSRARAMSSGEDDGLSM